MLAATLTTVVVFFPVTLLYGVSKFLFSALALSVEFRYSLLTSSRLPSSHSSARNLSKITPAGSVNCKRRARKKRTRRTDPP